LTFIVGRKGIESLLSKFAKLVSDAEDAGSITAGFRFGRWSGPKEKSDNEDD
jgi:hypothetical protein